MFYLLLADTLTLLHLAFVLFVLLGGLLVYRWRILIWAHIPAALWGAFVEFSGRVCPLTPLEISLRRQGGAEGYGGGFVEHYLLPMLYPAALTPEIQWLLGALVVVLNLAIYGLIWRKGRSS